MAKRHHSEMHRQRSEHQMEVHDGAMIGNDHSKFANLPTEVMMKPFPVNPAYMDFEYEDNIRGIDKQIGEDHSKRKSGQSPHKY
jgi:hypothetical protein